MESPRKKRRHNDSNDINLHGDGQAGQAIYRRNDSQEQDDNQDNDSQDYDEQRKFEKRKEDSRSRSCPYLDTINRGVLDFDFEKLCSVSLSKINVYACLVCGKYFQGKLIVNFS